MEGNVDDLIARFNSLNAGQYASQPEVPDIKEDDLPPSELQDRLNELRKPGSYRAQLAATTELAKEYREKHDDDYEYRLIDDLPPGHMKIEKLPLDTDVYSQAAKKIQGMERKRQSKKKNTKKKPVQKKKPVKKVKRKKKSKKKKKTKKTKGKR